MKYLIITMALLLPYSGMAEPTFSDGHTAMQRYFENTPAFATHKAVWLRYNRLMLSANTERIKAKSLAKAACQLLVQNGFTNIDVAVAVSDHRALEQNNNVKAVTERYCQR